MYYLNIFFLYSILGHLLEKMICPDHVSGILYGYWTPIYGIGVVLIILFYELFNNRLKLGKFTKPLAVLLIGFLLIPIIEYLGGFLIEKIFHITFWDYSDMKFHIGKYTSLEMAGLWALASFAIIYIIHPFLKSLILKIPKWITYTLLFLFFLDIFLTLFLRAK